MEDQQTVLSTQQTKERGFRLRAFIGALVLGACLVFAATSAGPREEGLFGSRQDTVVVVVKGERGGKRQLVNHVRRLH